MKPGAVRGERFVRRGRGCGVEQVPGASSVKAGAVERGMVGIEVKGGSEGVWVPFGVGEIGEVRGRFEVLGW